jgi:hypothetical protein
MDLLTNGAISDNVPRLGFDRTSMAIRACVAKLHLSSTGKLRLKRHRM